MLNANKLGASQFLYIYLNSFGNAVTKTIGFPTEIATFRGNQKGCSKSEMLPVEAFSKGAIDFLRACPDIIPFVVAGVTAAFRR